MRDPAALLDRATLRADLEGWLARQCGDEAHLPQCGDHRRADRAQPSGAAQIGAAGDVFLDILYDTLRKYDPGHLMLAITRDEAMRGLVDFGRLEAMLARIGDRIDHLQLERPSPLAAPLFLEMGRVPVDGAGRDAAGRRCGGATDAGCRA